ncbi:MAG: helix-hairpin-helix domain-containing protein, partial [Nanoarchaeota archaeon]
IICCTPTLAAGLSMPAFRVIIKSLKRYSGSWGMDWIPVLEYLQMAGRAGRPEFESFGEAITLAKDEAEKEDIHEKYVCGVPEEIYSKLAVEPVLRTYLLSLISSGIIHDEQSMNEFFGKTFWAHQYEDMNKLELIMKKMVSLLEEWEFIVSSSPEKKNAEFVLAGNVNALSSLKLRATPLGKRVSELYLDPLTARHMLDSLGQFREGKTSFSLLQMICHTLEMRPLLTVKKKESDTIQEELTKRYDLVLEKEPSPYDLEYDIFMNSIKTALFFEAWINEHDEEYLFEKFDIRPGEIHAKKEIADWLLYASEELASALALRDVVKELHKLRIRVEQGVKEELLPLLQLRGIGRVRGRKLYANGIKTIGEVKNADLTTLSQILGKKIAEEVQKQVGEDIKPIPAGTRKGQRSLERY